jgi:hypothetical protein
MPKLKKNELINKLIDMGIEIDHNYKYNLLYKLYLQGLKVNNMLNSSYKYKVIDDEKLITDISNNKLFIL